MARLTLIFSVFVWLIYTGKYSHHHHNNMISNISFLTNKNFFQVAALSLLVSKPYEEQINK